jgi:hypothetical protein
VNNLGPYGEIKHRDIHLQKWEVDLCKDEADHRLNNARQLGARPGFDPDEDSLIRAHLTGAFGEQALSKFTGIETYFFEPFVKDRADVGLIEVRTCGVGQDYGLRGYRTDEKHHFLCLARVIRVDETATVRLEGWIETHQFFSYARPHPTWTPHRVKGQPLILPKGHLRGMATLSREHQLAERFYT